jgi:hypothetical protein
MGHIIGEESAMSDAAIEQDSVIVRIRRDIAQSEKLIAERQKLSAEQEKLYAEALKLGRERWLAPVIAIGGLIVGGLGILVAFAGLVLRTH